jgi:hypothetical protein
VRSARRVTYRVLALAVLALLLVAGVSGCETTQDKAAAKQAESKRILDRREQRQKRKQHAKSDRKGGEKR